MKKIISMILVGICLALLLIGCEKNNEQPQNVVEINDTLSFEDLKSAVMAAKTFEVAIKLVDDNIAGLLKEQAGQILLVLNERQYKAMDDFYSAYGEIDLEKMFGSTGEINQEYVKSLPDSEAKRILTNIQGHLFKLIMPEGMWNIMIDHKAYTVKYAPYLESPYSDYFVNLSIESEYPSTTDGGIIISYDELKNRLYAYEDFISKNPSFIDIKTAKLRYFGYFNLLVFGANNTPAFDYETLMLSPELIKVYENLVLTGEHPYSDSYLKDYLMLLKESQYKQNEKIMAMQGQMFDGLKVDLGLSDSDFELYYQQQY